MFFHFQTVLNTFHHAAFNIRFLLFFTEKVLLCLVVLNHLCWLWNRSLKRWWKLWSKALLGGHTLVESHPVLFVQNLLAIRNVVPNLVNILSSQLTQRSGCLWIHNLLLHVALLFFQLSILHSLSILELRLIKFTREVLCAHFDIQVPVFVGFLLLDRIILFNKFLKFWGVSLKSWKVNLHAINSLSLVFCYQKMLSGIVEGNRFRNWLVIVLLQGVNVFPVFSIPELDLLVIRASDYNVFFLNEMNQLDDFMIGLYLPINLEL